MFKVNTVIFLIFIFCSNLSIAEQEVKIATHDVLPPYLYTGKDGKLTGIYYEIVNKAASRMPEYSVSFSILPWARAKAEVKSGKTFAILPPYFHAHDWLTDKKPKRPYIWPYSLSLFTQTDIIICNEKVLSKPRKKFPEDFEELNFVMSRGDGKAGEKFSQMVREKKIKLQEVQSTKDIVPFMLMGRADCAVLPKLSFYWYLNQLKKSEKYKDYHKPGVVLKEAKVLSKSEAFLGYTDVNADKKYPFKKDFAIKFDIEINRMKKSGEIDKIAKSYLEKVPKKKTSEKSSQK